MNQNNNNPIYGGLNLKEATRLHYLTNKKEKTEADKREVKTIEEKRSEYIRVLYRDWETDRKSTRLNSSHSAKSRMPSSA